MKLWNLEPVTIMGIVGALLTLLVVFGVHVSDPQIEAIKNFVAMSIPIVAAIIARGRVVPISAPDGPARLMKARAKAGLGGAGGSDAAAARSVYREPAPVEAPARMLADVPGWHIWGPSALLCAVGLAFIAAIGVAGCTPGEIQVAHGAIVIGGQVCEDVLTATDPALAPLCVTAAEVAEAIASLIEEQKAAARAAGKVGAEIEREAPPSRDAVYQRVIQNRAAKKGTVK